MPDALRRSAKACLRLIGPDASPGETNDQAPTALPPGGKAGALLRESEDRPGSSRGLDQNAEGATAADRDMVNRQRGSGPAKDPSRLEPDPKREPAPEGAPRVPTFVEYTPSKARTYVLSAIVVLASPAAVLALFVDAGEPDPGGFVLVIALATLAASAGWALTSWDPAIVSIRGGDLALTRGDHVRHIDLSDPETRVELGEQSGLRRWRAIVTDRDGRRVVIDARQVKACHFMRDREAPQG